MKIYLQNIVNRLKQYSESLDKQTMFINKPWALIDSELGIQKLIFKKNKELILSKDGRVTVGKWDYFPEAKSLLIDRGFDIILCNETYIDDSILVLKLDGKKDDFFVLANENNLPDLDAYAYLRNLYYDKYGIKNSQLADDRNIQIKPNNFNTVGSGSPVTIDDLDALDGEYITKDGSEKLYVQNKKIVTINYLKKYKLENGDYIVIEQKDENYFEIGSYVILNNQPLPDGIYLINKGITKIHIFNKRIALITYPIEYELSNITKIVIDQNNQDLFKKGDNVYINGVSALNGKYKINKQPNFKVQNGVIIKVGFKPDDIVLSCIIGFVLIAFTISILITFLNK